MLRNKHLRIVVDANCWISSLLSPAFQVRLNVVFDRKYRLLCSEKLFRELDRAVGKPYPAKRIVRVEYDELIFRLRTDAELVDVHSEVDVCRDPKDNYLLALAKDGNADYLITGDTDLLVLKKFGETKFINMSEFEIRHKPCESF